MGWNAAQKDAAGAERAAQIRANDARAARARRQRARDRDPNKSYARLLHTDLAARRTALLAIVKEFQPMNVRSVFYQAVGRGIVDKETGYSTVDRDLIFLRRSGAIPYSWITDGTRRRRTRYTCSGVAAALEDTRDQYRKSLWNDIDCNVEVWVDKDGVAGTIMSVCDKFDVDVMPYRGQSSDTFAFEAAQHLVNLDRPTYIYHLGDNDYWGVKAREVILKKLLEFVDGRVEIHFKHISLTPDQIRKWKLPTRPSGTKNSSAAVKAFGPATEIDAVPPDKLRALVEKSILRHMPLHQYNMLMIAEESERELLDALINRVEEEQ